MGTTDKEFKKLQPEIPKTISTQVLGELASAISTTGMETVALGWLGITDQEVNEKRFNSFRRSWLFNLAILELYTTKDNTSLKVMVHGENLRIDCVEVVEKIASVPAVTKETKTSIIRVYVLFCITKRQRNFVR